MTQLAKGGPAPAAAGMMLDTDETLAVLRARLGPWATPAQLHAAIDQITRDADAGAVPPDPGAALLLTAEVSRHILHNMQDAVVAARSDGTVIFLNRAAREMFGWRADEVLGQPLDTLVPGEAFTNAGGGAEICPVVGEERCPTVGADGTCGRPGRRMCRIAERLIVVGLRRDGNPFPAEASVLGIHDVIVLTMTDVSERIRAEEDKAKGLRVLRSLMDTLPGGITLFDAQLEMTTSNLEFRRLLAFPDRLWDHGQPSFEALVRFNAERGEYGPDCDDRVIEALLEKARHPVPHVYERVRPDGTVLEIRGAPLPDGGFLTIYIDITERKRAEEEAKRLATYLRTVLDTLPQGVSVFDENLELVLWNESFRQVLELPEAAVSKGVTLVELIRINAERGEYGSVDIDAYVRWRTSMAVRFEPHRFERTRPNGNQIEVQGRPMHLGEQIAGFVTTYTDLTELRRAEAAIRRANELVDDAIAYSPTYVWETDAAGRFTFLKGSDKVLGYAAEELVGRRFDSLHCAAPECHEFNLALAEAFVRRQPFEQLTSCAVGKTGGHMWISVSAHPIFDPRGFIGFRGVNFDVSELTRIRQELERMALHDPLTGLANRRKFLERFRLERDRQRRHGKPLALLVADIDHFKLVNDRFGHLTGDLCLRCVAEMLAMSVRKSDVVARFGGEEFVALLPETAIGGARTVAEKLRGAIETLNIPIDNRFEPLNITISIGVACLPAGEAMSFDDLMEVADQGLYGAKQAGRNRVCVYREQD